MFSWLSRKKTEGSKIFTLFEPNVNYKTKVVQPAAIPEFLMRISDKIGCKLYASSFEEEEDDTYPFISVPVEPSVSYVRLSEHPELEGNKTEVIEGETYVQKFWKSDPLTYHLYPILQEITSLDPDKVNLTIVGGGRTKCVTCTYRLLKYFGFNPVIEDAYCYDIRWVNSNRHSNIFNEPAVNFPKKYGLSEDGHLLHQMVSDRDVEAFIKSKLLKSSLKKAV